MTAPAKRRRKRQLGWIVTWHEERVGVGMWQRWWTHRNKRRVLSTVSQLRSEGKDVRLSRVVKEYKGSAGS